MPKATRFMGPLFRRCDFRPELEAVLVETRLWFARPHEAEGLRHLIAARKERGADGTVRFIGLLFGFLIAVAAPFSIARGTLMACIPALMLISSVVGIGARRLGSQCRPFEPRSRATVPLEFGNDPGEWRAKPEEF